MTVRKVDIFEIAQTKKTLEGELALFDFSELPDLLRGEEKKANVKFSSRAHKGKRGFPAVLLSLRATLRTACVHCGKPVDVAIEKELPFLLTTTEEEADNIPLEEDGDYEVVVGSRAFDVVHWVEEELILSLPAFPRHDDCVVDETKLQSEETEETLRKNKPFADLANLLKKN